MRLAPFFGLTLALAVAPATAGAGVVVGDGVPFTAAELEDALAARGEGAGAGTERPGDDVQVEAEGVAELRLTTAGRSWTVELGDARGASAARLVALHVVEREAGPAPGVAEPVAPVAPRRVAVAPALTPPEVDLDEPPAVMTRTSDGGGSWFAVHTGVSRGPSDTDLTGFVGGVELGMTRGALVGSAELGLHRSGTSEDAGGVGWFMPHLRLAAGLRRGPVDVMAGPLLGRLYLSGVDAAVADHTMVALGAAARVTLPLGMGPWRLTAGVGADAYRHRIVLENRGVEELSTPRVALSMTVGLTMVLGR